MATVKERRWRTPTKRAGDYAEERKLRMHKRGSKQGKELSDFEAGLRSGYLQCQSDHAGFYKFKKAMSDGKTVEEARKISKTIGKKK